METEGGTAPSCPPTDWSVFPDFAGLGRIRAEMRRCISEGDRGRFGLISGKCAVIALMLAPDDSLDKPLFDFLSGMEPSENRDIILGFLLLAGLGTDADAEGAYRVLKDTDGGKHLASILLGLNLVDDPEAEESRFMEDMMDLALHLMSLRGRFLEKDAGPEMASDLESLFMLCSSSDEYLQEAVFRNLERMLSDDRAGPVRERALGILRRSPPFDTPLYLNRMAGQCDGRAGACPDDGTDPRLLLLSESPISSAVATSEGQRKLIGWMTMHPGWSGDAVLQICTESRDIAFGDAALSEESLARTRRIADICPARLVPALFSIGFR